MKFFNFTQQLIYYTGYDALLLDRLFEQRENDRTDDSADEDAHEVHERVADGRDDEDAAVRRAQRAVKEHRECTRECGADDH